MSRGSLAARADPTPACEGARGISGAYPSCRRSSLQSPKRGTSTIASIPAPCSLDQPVRGPVPSRVFVADDVEPAQTRRRQEGGEVRGQERGGHRQGRHAHGPVGGADREALCGRRLARPARVRRPQLTDKVPDVSGRDQRRRAANDGSVAALSASTPCREGYVRRANLFTRYAGTGFMKGAQATSTSARRSSTGTSRPISSDPLGS